MNRKLVHWAVAVLSVAFMGLHGATASMPK